MQSITVLYLIYLMKDHLIMWSLPRQSVPFPVQAKSDGHAGWRVYPSNQSDGDKLTSSDSQQQPWPCNQSYRKLSNNIKYEIQETRYQLGYLHIYCNHIQAVALTILINVLVPCVGETATLRRRWVETTAAWQSHFVSFPFSEWIRKKNWPPGVEALTCPGNTEEQSKLKPK